MIYTRIDEFFESQHKYLDTNNPVIMEITQLFYAVADSIGEDKVVFRTNDVRGKLPVVRVLVEGTVQDAATDKVVKFKGISFSWEYLGVGGDTPRVLFEWKDGMFSLNSVSGSTIESMSEALSTALSVAYDEASNLHLIVESA